MKNENFFLDIFEISKKMLQSVRSAYSSFVNSLVAEYQDSGKEPEEFAQEIAERVMPKEKSGKAPSKTSSKKVSFKHDSDDEGTKKKPTKTPIYILLETSAKSHGVFCRKQDREVVLKALKKGPEKIEPNLVKLGHKYDGFPFSTSLLKDVKAKLANLEDYRVVPVNFKKFVIPEGEEWSGKPPAAPKKTGQKKAQSKKSKKDESSSEEDDSDEDSSESSEEQPKKKASAKKPSGKKSAGGKGKSVVQALGLKENEAGNLVHNKSKLVFTKLKVDGSDQFVCVGTQGSIDENADDPLESVDALNGTEDKAIKTLAKQNGVEITVLTDIVDSLDKSSKKKMIDMQLIESE